MHIRIICIINLLLFYTFINQYMQIRVEKRHLLPTINKSTLENIFYAEA